MVRIHLSCKLHKHFFLRNTISQLLEHLFDFIVELSLTPNNIKSFNQLLHYFATVLLVLSAQHTHKIHYPFDKTAVVEVKVLNQPLKNILVRIKQSFTVGLEHHCVPKDNGLLGVTGISTFRLKFFLQTQKDEFVFFLCFENLNNSL